MKMNGLYRTLKKAFKSPVCLGTYQTDAKNINLIFYQEKGERSGRLGIDVRGSENFMLPLKEISRNLLIERSI